MLRLIPPGLHIIALRSAHALRLRWWRIARVRVRGCRVLALNPQGHVLLIRHSYGSGNWMLPGGGMKRGEDAVAAGCRELAEETAVVLTGARVIAVMAEEFGGGGHEVSIVAGQTHDQPRPDRREIVDAGFFAPDALPCPLSPQLAHNLPVYLKAATAAPHRAAD